MVDSFKYTDVQLHDMTPAQRRDAVKHELEHLARVCDTMTAREYRDALQNICDFASGISSSPRRGKPFNVAQDVALNQLVTKK